MTSRRFEGIRFVVYPQDHEPRHVHAFVGEAEVIVNLLEDGNVALAEREDAVRPANAKKSDIKKALRVVADNFEELAAMWERMHEE